MPDYAKILNRIDFVISILVIAGLIYFGVVNFKLFKDSLPLKHEPTITTRAE